MGSFEFTALSGKSDGLNVVTMSASGAVFRNDSFEGKDKLSARAVRD